MDRNKFLNSIFFDSTNFAFSELLKDRTPWESVSNILEFIEKLFAASKFAPNYKERLNVHVGEGTKIHPSVDIEDGAIIGKNCTISHGAFLRGGCIIGDNVHIGHAVEIKHSILLNNSAIAHFNYIPDSIIGLNVNISAGTIIADLRLDRQNIVIKTDSGNIDTGLQKFGAAIGDNSMIGAGSIINPGTLLGKGNVVYPLKSIKGVHEDNETLK